MAVRDDRSDVKQTTAGFRGPLMVQSLTYAKSKFLSLVRFLPHVVIFNPRNVEIGDTVAINYFMMIVALPRSRSGMT